MPRLNKHFLAFAILAATAFSASAYSKQLTCNLSHPGGHSEKAIVRINDSAAVVSMYWVYKRSDGSFCNLDPTGASWIADEHLILRNGCQLYFWRQDNRITIAPDMETCRSSCSSKSSHQGLLPVSFDIRTGNCADK